MDTLRRSPSFTTGGWAWIYNTAATICLGAKKGTDATILKTKFSSNWSGPFKILPVGPAPASAVPDGRPLHGKLLYFYLPSDMPGRDSKRHASVVRCKPSRNPDDIHDLLTNRPADLTKYVLNSVSTKSPPFNVTLDDISPPPERLEVEQITGHKLVCGRGGVLAVLYETHWAGLLSFSWERNRDLQHHRLHSHSPLLDRHPVTTPPDKALIPPDAHRTRPLRTLVVPGRTFPLSRVQPCLTHSLAQQLELFNSSRRGAPLVQGPQWSLVIGQSRSSRALGYLFIRRLRRSLPRRPRPDQDQPLPSTNTTSRSVVQGS